MTVPVMCFNPLPDTIAPPRLPDHIDGGPVHLDRWRENDIDDIAAMGVASYEFWRPWVYVPARNEPQLWEYHLAQHLQHFTSNWRWSYAVRADGILVAEVSATDRSDNGETIAEIGYQQHVDHCGLGHVVHAVEALIGVCFAAGFDTIRIGHDDANIASAAVPRRLGFTETSTWTYEPRRSGETGHAVGWTLTR